MSLSPPNDGMGDTATVTKLYEAQLQKMGALSGSWTQRYFVLLQNGLLLSCKKEDPDNDGDRRVKKLKVKARLSMRSTVRPTVFADSGWHTFQVLETEDGEPIHLRAQSPEEQRRWISALTEVIDNVADPVPPAFTPIVDGSNFIMPLRAIRGRQASLTHHEDRLQHAFSFTPFLSSHDIDSSDEAPRIGLTLTVRLKLEEALRDIVARSSTGYAIMIVDRPAMRALTGVYRMSELVDLGILTVEPLERRRQPLEGIDVIYFLSPDFVMPIEDGADHHHHHLRNAAHHQQSVAPQRRQGSAMGFNMLHRGPVQMLTSLERMLKDFPRPRHGHKRVTSRYTNCTVHVLFVSKPKDPLNASIKMAMCKPLCASLLDHGGVASDVPAGGGGSGGRGGDADPISRFGMPYTIQFLSSGFEILGSHQFALGMESSLGPILTRSAEDMLPTVAKQLAECFFSLQEFPYVRYARSSPTASTVAHLLGDQLEELIRRDSSWRFHGQIDPGRRSTLLIMARNEDFKSPLLHDFTLRSLLHDGLSDYIEDGTLTLHGRAGEEIVFPLSVQNSIWRQYRHRHLDDAVTMVASRTKELSALDTAKLERGEAELTSEQLLKVGDYGVEKASLAHLQRILKELFHVVASEKLLPDGGAPVAGVSQCITDCEQLLATGCDFKGNRVSARTACDAVVAELQRSPSLSSRARLILLAAVSNIHIMDDLALRERVFGACGVDEEYQELAIALHLVSRDARQIEEVLGDGDFEADGAAEAAERTQAADSIRFELQRYHCRVTRMAQRLLDGTLPDEPFPYVREPPPGYDLCNRIRDTKEKEHEESKRSNVQRSARRRRVQDSNGRESKGSPRSRMIDRLNIMSGSNRALETDAGVATAQSAGQHRTALNRRRSDATLRSRKNSMTRIKGPTNHALILQQQQQQQQQQQAYGQTNYSPPGAKEQLAPGSPQMLRQEAHRLIIFVIGGLSLVEAEQLEALGDDKEGEVDIIVGGTHVLTAEKLIDEAIDCKVTEVYL